MARFCEECGAEMHYHDHHDEPVVVVPDYGPEAAAQVEIARINAERDVQLAKISNKLIKDEALVEAVVATEVAEAVVEAVTPEPEPEPEPVVIVDPEPEPLENEPPDDAGPPAQHRPHRTHGLGAWLCSARNARS